jgi:hypothetical protein
VRGLIGCSARVLGRPQRDPCQFPTTASHGRAQVKGLEGGRRRPRSPRPRAGKAPVPVSTSERKTHQVASTASLRVNRERSPLSASCSRGSEVPAGMRARRRRGRPPEPGSPGLLVVGSEGQPLLHTATLAGVELHAGRASDPRSRLDHSGDSPRVSPSESIAKIEPLTFVADETNPHWADSPATLTPVRPTNSSTSEAKRLSGPFAQSERRPVSCAIETSDARPDVNSPTSATTAIEPVAGLTVADA